ncbi:hypothetical protein Trydic_g18363 [Trypoxylus dichotomus]
MTLLVRYTPTTFHGSSLMTTHYVWNTAESKFSRDRLIWHNLAQEFPSKMLQMEALQSMEIAIEQSFRYVLRADSSNGIWFQQNGGTAHTAHETLDLREQFWSRVILTKGDLRWPPRSPNLICPEFF